MELRAVVKLRFLARLVFPEHAGDGRVQKHEPDPHGRNCKNNDSGAWTDNHFIPKPLGQKSAIEKIIRFRAN